MAATKKRPSTRRGSPEAIAKRRAARALNRLFEEGGATGNLDGRTLKRKRRLLKELKEGKGGKPLKALEVLTRANELLSLGETLTSLRRLKPQLPPTPVINDASAAVYLETQKNYGFSPKAWKLLGVDINALGEAKKPRKKRSGKSSSGKKG